jgi:SNW domain-containing protein 1
MKYKSHTSGQVRIVRIKEVQEDPFAPAQYKKKRAPPGPGSPPEPITRSPPKKLSLKDQMEFKIPPCISNWKNPKGYTIPIEMRLSADGRTLKTPTVNEKFSHFTTALHLSEKQAKKELEEKARIQKTLKFREMQKKEEEMRQRAREAREEKDKIFKRTDQESESESSSSSSEERPRKRVFDKMLESEVSSRRSHRSKKSKKKKEKKSKKSKKLKKKIKKKSKKSKKSSKLEFNRPGDRIKMSKEERQRNIIRHTIKREAEREHRLSKVSSQKGKMIREKERELAEKLALNQNIGTGANTGGLGFDERLVNMDSGLDSGFKGSSNPELYDKPLFAQQIKHNIYAGAQEVLDNEAEDEEEIDYFGRIDQVTKKRKNKKKEGPVRRAPVEFEKYDGKDIFGGMGKVMGDGGANRMND